MKVYGYSERGAVNALAYEIAGSANPERLIEQLLSLAVFPGPARPVLNVTAPKFLIEQSFSDFGDADLVVLARHEERSFAAFFECKVKTFSRRRWSITEEFGCFVRGTETGLDSSNLFTQLYHKQRMVQCMANAGIQSLAAGVPFPCCSTKVGRKIGENGVVLKAARMVCDYLQAPTLFLAVVPDSDESILRFCRGEFGLFHNGDLEGWDIENWGFVSWARIKEFCLSFHLEHTSEVLEYNAGQIY